ncbi:hypothetical protein ACGU0V_000853 [Serratia marcescens]
MSWHHEDYIGLFSAIGGVVSAGAAAYAALQSHKSARDSRLQQLEAARVERERHLYELLRSDAARANESVKTQDSSDWTYSQASNITNAIDSARNRITASSPYLTPEQISQLKSYLKEQLSHEIKSELKNDTDPPDAFYKPKCNWRESESLVNTWKVNQKFFDFNNS